jgi:hypothetical protein
MALALFLMRLAGNSPAGSDVGGETMSSISAVSGLGSIYDTAQTSSSQGNNPFSEFEQLASSLQSGNLSGAQQAYNALASMMQNAPSSSPSSTAFKALGQALQSGNLQAAQQAFSSLQQNFAQSIMSAGGHHHHGGGGGHGGSQLLSALSSDNTSDGSTSSGSTASSTTSASSDSSQTNNVNNLLNLFA